MTVPMVAPTAKRVRAYFAPVNRQNQQPAIFDAAALGGFDLDNPPQPWVDLGWIADFERTSETAVQPIRAGSPAMTRTQVRGEAGATVRFSFASWGKLQMSLSSGVQQMNLLVPQSGATPAGAGGPAQTATALLATSTASVLQVDPQAAGAFAAGGFVVVDVDYAQSTTGYVGAGASGAFLRSAVSDVDYVRRVSLNVSRVMAVSGGALTLETPLPGGAPVPGMKVSAVLGFCDREGSTFFQEWSALFVAEGPQGDRVLWHYPRLQAAGGIAESRGKALGEYSALWLQGAFRALPLTDGEDGERVLCYRSYLP